MKYLVLINEIVYKGYQIEREALNEYGLLQAEYDKYHRSIVISLVEIKKVFQIKKYMSKV